MPIVIPPASFIPSRYGAVVLVKQIGISQRSVVSCIWMLPWFCLGTLVLTKQLHLRSAGSTSGWTCLLGAIGVFTSPSVL